MRYVYRVFGRGSVCQYDRRVGDFGYAQRTYGDTEPYRRADFVTKSNRAYQRLQCADVQKQNGSPNKVRKAAKYQIIILVLLALTAGLSLERKAVGALSLCGISFVSSYLNLVERAVIFARAVMLAVVDSTADVFVCKFGSHNNNILSLLITACAVILL